MRKATMNADPVDQWHFGSAIVGTDREKHLVAVSDNPVVIEIFGIPEENLSRFWDWVGSIFSVWGAIVHSAQNSLAKFVFEECLHGVEEIDKHSLTDPLEQNIPAILALIECQNSAEPGVGALCVLPYDKHLNTVIPWLRQRTMESFGKASTLDNKSLRKRTRLPIWGGNGKDSQLSLGLWLHEGTRSTSIGFMWPTNSGHNNELHFGWLVSNAKKAQCVALVYRRQAE